MTDTNIEVTILHENGTETLTENDFHHIESRTENANPILDVYSDKHENDPHTYRFASISSITVIN